MTYSTHPSKRLAISSVTRVSLLAVASIIALATGVGFGLARPANASECERLNVTAAAVSPSNQAATPGTTLTYGIDATNNDNTFCAASELTFTNRSLPAGWTATPASETQPADPQEVVGYAIAYTSPATAYNGDYDFVVDVTRAEDPGYTASVTVRYTITGNPAPDTAAPSVNITSPTAGATVKKNTNVTISAAASDAVGVTRLDFLVNGSVVCTGTATSCVWHVPSPRNVTYTLQVKAYDQAGNVGTSSISVVAK